MTRRIIALLLLVGLVLPLFVAPQSYAIQNSSGVITVNRTTYIYPNYAVSLDTITVVNGSLTSLIAQFPTNTTVLRINGSDVLYAYQLSLSPSREVVVFKNTLLAGESTQIEYVYTGFLSSGELEIGFQAGYSLASVNDTSTYFYGMPNWGVTLQIFYNNHYLNVSQGQKFTFKGETTPNNFVTATNPSSTTMPTSYQAYIETLSRKIDYSNGIFHIQDQSVFVWASTTASNKIYLFMPNSLINKSITVSYFYGNVSSTLNYKAYPGFTLLTIDSPIELALNQKIGLQIDYSVRGQQLNLSSLGLYGMFCDAYSIIAGSVKPVTGNWTSMGSNYFAALTGVTAQNMNGYIVSGVGVSPDLVNGTSLAVLIVGVFAVASSYTYSQTKTRKKIRRVVPQSVIKNLESAASSIDLAYNTVKKFLEGGVRASVANSALASFDDLERKLLRELNEGVGKNDVSEEMARKLSESLKEIRNYMADLIDLQIQFSQKRIRQNIYLDLRSKYQRGLLRAINNFKQTTNDLRQT